MESALSSFSHTFCLNFDSFSILMLLIPIDFILGPFDFIWFCCSYLALSANSVKIIQNSSTAALFQDPHL